MKKAFLLFGLISFFSFRGMAQGEKPESDGMGPYIGGTAAIHNTWIVIDNEYPDNEHHKHNFTFGPAVGLVLGHKFNQRHSIQIEGFYSKQGAKYDLLDEANDKTIGDKEIDLHYISIPLLFKLSGIGKTRFNIHFGPQVGILLGGEERNTYNQDITDTKDFQEGTPAFIPKGTYLLASTDSEERKKADDMKGEPGSTGNFNKYDPSVVLGLGVEHDLTDQLYLSANLRFNYAFKDIRDQETVRDAYNRDVYTLRYNVLGGIQVGIHYFFRKP